MNPVGNAILLVTAPQAKSSSLGPASLAMNADLSFEPGTSGVRI
jgi:hypothetical protein